MAVGLALALSAFLRGDKTKCSANHAEINEISPVRGRRNDAGVTLSVYSRRAAVLACETVLPELVLTALSCTLSLHSLL